MSKVIKIVETDVNDPLLNYMLMVSCLEKLASPDEVHYLKEYSAEDVDAFMENLDGNVIKQIQKFFETMPKLRHEMNYRNKNGDDKTFVVEGMRSFFT